MDTKSKLWGEDDDAQPSFQAPPIPEQPPISIARAQTLARSSSNPRAQQAGEAMLAEDRKAQARAFHEQGRADVLARKQAESDAKQQARDLERQAREDQARAVRQGAAAGMKVTTDVETGQRSIATHDDGKPMFKAGPIGEPVETPTVNRDLASAPGLGGMITAGAIGRPADYTGTELSQTYRTDRGAEIVRPLPTKTDPKNGEIYSTVKDSVSGMQVRRSLGTDEKVANDLAKKAEFDQRRTSMDLKANNVAQARTRFDPQWQPVKKEFDEAGTKRNAFNEAPRFMLAPDPNSRGQAMTWVKRNPATGKPEVNGPSPKADTGGVPSFEGEYVQFDRNELIKWQRDKDQVEGRYARAKAAHDKLLPGAESFNTAEKKSKLENLLLRADELKHKGGGVDDGGASMLLAQAETGELSPEHQAAAEIAEPVTPTGIPAGPSPKASRYPMVKPDPENDAWFKENPNVTGMAWGAGLNESDPKSARTVMLNPYSNLTKEQTEGVAMNESLRHFMDEEKPALNFKPTAAQIKSFEGTEYGKPENESRLKETLVARILTGDESAGDVTPEQQKAAEDVWRQFNGPQFAEPLMGTGNPGSAQAGGKAGASAGEAIGSASRPLIPTDDAGKLAVFSKAFSGLAKPETLTIGESGERYTFLKRNGRNVGSVEKDKAGNPFVVLGNGNETEDIRQAVDFSNTKGIPVYIADSITSSRDTVAEARYVADVFEAAHSAADDAEANTRLNALRATPDQIAAKVRQGELSVQHGEALVKGLYGASLQPEDPLAPATFGKWLEKSDATTRDSWTKAKTPKQKQAVKGEFLKEWYADNKWRPGVGEEDLHHAVAKLMPGKTPEGVWATFGRELGTKAAPALGTAAGGLAAGALAIETGPGAIAADIAAGTAAGLATSALQKRIMGAEWTAENEEQMQANAKANPIASTFGSMVPFLVSILGGGGAAVRGTGGKVVGKAATNAGAKVLREAFDKNLVNVARGAAQQAAPAMPLLERVVRAGTLGARAGGSEGAQDRYVHGKDVSVIDTAARGALTFAATGILPPAKVLGAMGFFPAAKDVLTQATKRGVTDAAAMTFAGSMYDAAVHGKVPSFKGIADELGGSIPAFVLQNLVMGALHRGMPGKGGKSDSPAPSPFTESVDGMRQAKGREVGSRMDDAAAGPAVRAAAAETDPVKVAAMHPTDYKTWIESHVDLSPDGGISTHEGLQRTEAALTAARLRGDTATEQVLASQLADAEQPTDLTLDALNDGIEDPVDQFTQEQVDMFNSAAVKFNAAVSGTRTRLGIQSKPAAEAADGDAQDSLPGAGNGLQGEPATGPDSSEVPHETPVAGEALSSDATGPSSRAQQSDLSRSTPLDTAEVAGPPLSGQKLQPNEPKTADSGESGSIVGETTAIAGETPGFTPHSTGSRHTQNTSQGEALEGESPALPISQEPGRRYARAGNIELDPHRRDFVDFVAEHPINIPKDKSGGEHDGFREWHQSIPPLYKSERHFSTTGGRGIAEVADAAWREGHIHEPTAASLMGKYSEAISNRKQARTAGDLNPLERKAMALERKAPKQAKDFDTALVTNRRSRAGEQVVAGDLAEGETFEFQGERFKVTKSEAVEGFDGPEGLVVLQDHDKFGTQVVDASLALRIGEKGKGQVWEHESNRAQEVLQRRHPANGEPTPEDQNEPSFLREKKPAPPSKMDTKNADSKELFANDGGFALSQESTVDGAKVATAREAAESAAAASDHAQGRFKFADATIPTTTDGWIKLRETRRAAEVGILRREIGLTGEQAEQAHDLVAVRGGTGDNWAKKNLSPEQLERWEEFWEESPYNRADGPVDFWQYDQHYDPEKVGSETSVKELSVDLVLAFTNGLKQSASDKWVWAVTAARKLQELGASKEDVSQALQAQANRVSGTQSDAEHWHTTQGKEINNLLSVFAPDMPLRSGDGKAVTPVPAKIETVTPTSDVATDSPDTLENQPAEKVEQAAAETHPEPTEGQKEAGNYRKGKVTLHGMLISIENARGSIRSGTDRNGKTWETEMAHHYGYFLGSKARDGDHVDTFIGPDPDSEKVFIVNQITPSTGRFDEHKVMLGFNNRRDAIEGYHASYSKGWKGLGDMVETTVADFKRWLEKGNTMKPVKAGDFSEPDVPAKTSRSLPKGIPAPDSKSDPAKSPPAARGEATKEVPSVIDWMRFQNPTLFKGVFQDHVAGKNAADIAKSREISPKAVENIVKQVQAFAAKNGIPLPGSKPAAKAPDRPKAAMSPGAASQIPVSPTPVGNVGKPVSAPDVIASMGSVLKSVGTSTPLRIGRLSSNKALGEFYVRERMVRIRTAGDIATAAHELGHALQKAIFGNDPRNFALAGASPAAIAELDAMGRALYGSTVPNGGYLSEGFAEWFSVMAYGGDALAAAAAPQFHQFYKSQIEAKNPQLAKTVKAAQVASETWRNQGDKERARQSVYKRPGRIAEGIEATGEFARTFGTDWIDSALPIARFVAEATEKGGKPIPAKEDPFATLTALRMSHNSRVEFMVDNAMINFAGEKIGKGLHHILAPVRGMKSDFMIYLWAKRAVALWNDPAGPRNPGLTEADAAGIISQIETPLFQRVASEVYKWNDQVLDYAAEASPDYAATVAKIRARDPGFYIPLFREFDAFDSVSKIGGSAASGKLLDKLRGSGRRIKDPFQGMIGQASALVLKSHQKLVLDQIFKIADATPDMGNLVMEVPRDRVPAASREMGDLIDEINSKLKAGGAAEIQLTPEQQNLMDEVLTFFTPAYSPAKQGENPILPVFRAGKIHWFEMDHELYRTLAGMDGYRLPKALDLFLGMPARTFRMGTTGLRASFSLVTNPLRDFRTLHLNSKASANSGLLFATWIQEMGKAFMYAATGGHIRPESIDVFERLGGKMATPLGQDTRPTERATRRLFETTGWRIVDVRNWADFARDILQFPEMASRITEMRLVGKDIGWQPGMPMTEEVALQLLTVAKQVTTDFTAAGRLAKVVNQAVPFFNAGIQGPRGHVRAINHHLAQFLARGLAGTALVLGLWWLNKDSDWWKELSDKEKFGFTYIPFEHDGKKDLMRIPRAFEADGLFMAGAESLADAWYQKEPEKATEWFQNWTGRLVTPGVPVLASITAEQLANKNFFYDTPIVPRSEEAMEASEQVGPYTTRVAELLGQVSGASPRRIDHAIKGLFGGAGSDFAALFGQPKKVPRESELVDTPVLGTLFVRGGQSRSNSQSVEALYDELEDANKIEASPLKDETPQQKEKRLLLQDAQKAIVAISQAQRLEYFTKSRRELDDLRNQIARDAVGNAKAGNLNRNPTSIARRQAEALLARKKREKGHRTPADN